MIKQVYANHNPWLTIGWVAYQTGKKMRALENKIELRNSFDHAALIKTTSNKNPGTAIKGNITTQGKLFSAIDLTSGKEVIREISQDPN